jgi:hypothetical protein
MRAALVAALLLAWPASAAAAPELVKVGDFAQPVHVAAPPGDGSRLFVVEQAGRVRVVVDGQPAATPFLDLTDVVATAYERGLLSIAFPGDYASSGLFYVFLTARSGFAPSGETGDIVVLEGRRSAADPNRADPAHRRIVFSIPHPVENHNGGQLAFGPDGLLYVSTGDGGGQGDPGDDAQSTVSLLGKILRVDPRAPAGPQIYALGLRNPWRFSFDRVTGDLTIGDVGGNISEEIDFSPAGAGPGRNYGWNVCEGDSPPNCPHIAPALSLPRSDGYQGVIGGFVVRDPGLPTLLGRYLFGDLAKPTVMSVQLGASGATGLRGEGTLPISFPSSFGEDACGRLYAAAHDGPVYRLQDGAPSACGFPGQPGAPGGLPSAPASDAEAPKLKLSFRGTQRFRRLRIALRPNEDCRATLRAKRYRIKRVQLKAGARRVVRMKATRRGVKRLRRAFTHRRRVELTIRIAARDAAGNVRHRRARVELRR